MGRRMCRQRALHNDERKEYQHRPLKEQLAYGINRFSGGGGPHQAPLALARLLRVNRIIPWSVMVSGGDIVNNQ